MITLFRSNSIRDAAERAYGRVVEQARRPGFFIDCGVPDTLDGRFELICLHAFLYLHRLKRERQRAAPLGQRFFDTMFADFDRSLREMGTGDLSVGREIKGMAEAFYGRVAAYEQGLAGDDSVLQPALARNLFGTAPPTQPGSRRWRSMRARGGGLISRARRTAGGPGPFGIRHAPRRARRRGVDPMTRMTTGDRHTGILTPRPAGAARGGTVSPGHQRQRGGGCRTRPAFRSPPLDRLCARSSWSAWARTGSSCAPPLTLNSSKAASSPSIRSGARRRRKFTLIYGPPEAEEEIGGTVDDNRLRADRRDVIDAGEAVPSNSRWRCRRSRIAGASVEHRNAAEDEPGRLCRRASRLPIGAASERDRRRPFAARLPGVPRGFHCCCRRLGIWLSN
jgi:cytochrome b pre-mRNA-processing protein 3